VTPLGSEARIRGWVWAMTPAGSKSIGTMFCDPPGSEARIRGWVWAMTPAGSQSIGTMFRDLMWSEARIRGWVWAMTPAGSQSIGTMLCDPAGVRSTHSWLGLGRDPSGVTEHRNDRRTKVFDPPYGGSQRRRDSWELDRATQCFELP